MNELQQLLKELHDNGIDARWNNDNTKLLINTGNSYIKHYYEFNRKDPASNLLFGANPCVRINDNNLAYGQYAQAQADFRSKSSIYQVARKIVAKYDLWDPNCRKWVEDQKAEYWLNAVCKVDAEHKSMVAIAYTQCKSGEDFTDWECASLYRACKDITQMSLF